MNERPHTQWAPNMAGNQAERLLDLIQTYIAEHRLAIQIDRQHGNAVGASGVKYFFTNLAQMVGGMPLTQWPAAVEEYMGGLTQSLAEQAFSEPELADFSQARPTLAVRLLEAEAALDRVMLNSIARADLEGVHTALVFDLPTSLRNVRREEAEAWGIPPAELFAAGLDNVRQKYPVRPWIDEMGGGGRVFVFSADHFFVASHALLLDDDPVLSGPYGALVGIPNRHALLVHPVHDAEIIPALERLLPAAVGMHREGPGSITPNLYWYHAGVFTNLPYTVEGNQLNFDPPEAFAELMQRLAG